VEGSFMLTTLALLATLPLSAGQPNGLTLSGAAVTHGLLGPVRADARFLPGDTVSVAFDIEGLTFGPDGKAAYTTVTELTDAAGKTLFRSPAREQEVVNALGGNRLPAGAHADLGLGQAPGEYTLKVTVTDKASGQSQSLAQKFTVLPAAFGLVGLSATADRAGEVPAGPAGAGQTLWLGAAVVGFRTGQDQQPKVELALRVLDEAGKPTLPAPFTGRFENGVPAGATALPVQFALSLTRPGKFTLELKATDLLSGGSATATYPLTVLPAR
jgi:hypothetical protein